MNLGSWPDTTVTINAMLSVLVALSAVITVTHP